MAKAMEYLDDDLIIGATKQKAIQTTPAWVKWGSLAACFAIAVIALGAAMPKLFHTAPPLTDHESSTEAGDCSDTQTEAVYEMGDHKEIISQIIHFFAKKTEEAHAVAWKACERPSLIASARKRACPLPLS